MVAYTEVWWLVEDVGSGGGRHLMVKGRYGIALLYPPLQWVDVYSFGRGGEKGDLVQFWVN